jgi:hypothetical protein
MATDGSKLTPTSSPSSTDTKTTDQRTCIVTVGELLEHPPRHVVGRLGQNFSACVVRMAIQKLQVASRISPQFHQRRTLGILGLLNLQECGVGADASCFQKTTRRVVTRCQGGDVRISTAPTLLIRLAKIEQYRTFWMVRESDG